MAGAGAKWSKMGQIGAKCPFLGHFGAFWGILPPKFYIKRVIVTPAVYPRLVEFLHFDIQSTGQKSHCVNIL